MKQDHTLKVRCWKCQETFHAVVAPEDHNQRSRLVLKIVPCPYCKANCQLTLREDQVFATEVTRGGSSPAKAPQTWAQVSELERTRTVYDTQQPDARPPKAGD
jgi:hypothetical protein